MDFVRDEVNGGNLRVVHVPEIRGTYAERVFHDGPPPPAFPMFDRVTGTEEVHSYTRVSREWRQAVVSDKVFHFTMPWPDGEVWCTLDDVEVGRRLLALIAGELFYQLRDRTPRV